MIASIVIDGCCCHHGYLCIVIVVLIIILLVVVVVIVCIIVAFPTPVSTFFVNRTAIIVHYSHRDDFQCDGFYLLSSSSP